MSDLSDLFKGQNFSPFLKKLQREMAEDMYMKARARLPADLPIPPPWQELSQQEQNEYINQFSWIS